MGCLEFLGSKRFRVVLVGFSFFCLFTAFNTAAGVEETVIDSFQSEHSSFKGSGYISLSLLYITFAFSNWFAPPVIALFGPKWSLFISSLTYTLFAASFLYLVTWVFYTVSIFIGFGAAVLWTSQGAYLAMNSDSHSISVNSAIFWAMFQSANLGGLIATVLFNGNDDITNSQRTELFAILVGASIVANVSFLFLPKSQGGGSGKGSLLDTDEDAEGLVHDRDSAEGASVDEHECVSLATTEAAVSNEYAMRDAFVQSMRLFMEPKMLLLFWTFFYSGIATSFFTGVYGTCLGNTAYWPQSKSYVGLATVIGGAGQVSASLFGGASRKCLRIEGQTVVLVGALIHISCFFLIFLNIPTDTPMKSTFDTAYINPNEYLGLGCSFLLGFGDGCLETEIMNLLVMSYPTRSAPAFSLYKFSQSLSCAIAFFYSTYLNLNIQLSILLVFNIISSLCFFSAFSIG